MPVAAPGHLDYPRDPSQEVRVPVAQLRQVVVAVLIRKSMFQFDADIVADRMLDADLRGIEGHGCVALPRYVEMMDSGNVDPRGRVLVERETPATAVMDGSRAMGQVAATRGMELAIKKARDVGTGTIVIHHSLHLGAASAYALLAAREGLIGCCISNPAGRGVAAPGTTRSAVANAPFAWAIPAADGPPIVIDFACGATSWGKLRVLQAYGLPIPDGLAFDEQGQPTHEPSVGKTLAPAGGVQGFALGLIANLVISGLSGGKPFHKKSGTVLTECSEHLLTATNIEAFADRDRFLTKAAEARAAIRALPPTDPAISVRVPGDRGARELEDRQMHGIPVHRSLLDGLTACARKLKIEVPWS
jgi:LDH2 family malate/lactate/ureidoglycolate dehydrogenase